MSPRSAAHIPEFSEDAIVAAGLNAVERAIDHIHSEVEHNPQAFRRYIDEDLKKRLIAVDATAERTARDCLLTDLSERIEIRGEESSLARVGTVKLAALMDMLDGSDLLERGLGNWCSAVTIFSTDPKQIIASFVGVPNREIYFCRRSSPDVFVRKPRLGSSGPQIQEIIAPSTEMRLRDAGVCFYGQKSQNLLHPLIDCPKFVKRLQEIATESRTLKESKTLKASTEMPRFRIYNLGGIPMMISVIEGRVDAVFEVRGQKCHDVVPGLVMALKAGAVVLDLEGSPFTLDRISEKLENPDDTFTYVLSSSEPLAKELVGLLHR